MINLDRGFGTDTLDVSYIPETYEHRKPIGCRTDIVGVGISDGGKEASTSLNRADVVGLVAWLQAWLGATA